MSLHTVTLLQRQLDTTLQLLISFSSTMTTDDIVLARIRLAEADVVIGHVLAERDNATNNGI